MRTLTILLICFLTFPALGQDPVPFDLFYNDSICEMRLHYNERAFRKAVRDEEYQDANLEWIRSPGDTVSMAIELKPRGNMRKDYCSLPPMMLRFPKKEYDDRKVKLVRPCRNDDQYENYIMAEYAVYRMFNVVSDSSFRVQLVHMTYFDSSGKVDPYTHIAFFIENDEQLAARLGGVNHQNAFIANSKLDKKQLDLVTFFQYMIGNTDWGTVNKHNLEMIVDTNNLNIITIPYDFDYCGFVEAPYAQPQEGIPIEHIAVRYNRGYCMDEQRAEQLRLKFKALEDDIMGVCKIVPGMEERYRRQRLKYMQEYFRWLDKKQHVSYVFSKNCKQVLN